MIPDMLAIAALSGPLPKLGVAVAGLLIAAALLAPSDRGRALATLGALVLAPVLLLAEIWHSAQLNFVHRHPLPALVAAVIAVAALAAAAVLLARRPALFAPVAVFTLPFRVPIHASGKTSNLLVPLYFVVAAGALAWLVPVLVGGRRTRRAAAEVRSRRPEGRHGVDPIPEAPRRQSSGPVALTEWTVRLLALFVVLYGVQATYSKDFTTALQNMVFFYVPFALLFARLRAVRFTAVQIRQCLAVAVGLALVFSLIGFVEYATKTIVIPNPKLIQANGLHTYFTVSSVFYDPDIFGRFLALTMVLVAVLLLYRRSSREQIIATGVLAVLWACLVLTLSRSSLAALLVGLAVLAALRYRPSRALVAAIVVIAIGAAAVAVSPTTFGLNQGVNGASSGRGGLVSGGLSMFADRPGWGYGSGAFAAEYHHRHPHTALAASHTIPVTIAAEQGIIGEVVYLAFVVCALICLLRGARGDPVRGALAAAFAALVFDTMLYADFLEDPVMWALLAAGLALAAAHNRQPATPHTPAPAAV